MRRRGARECEEALMEAAEARRGYTRVAAWDEGNLIQAMARLKNPTIAWRKRDDTGMDDTRDRAPTYYPPPPPSPAAVSYMSYVFVLTPSPYLGLSRDCCCL